MDISKRLNTKILQELLSDNTLKKHLSILLLVISGLILSSLLILKISDGWKFIFYFATGFILWTLVEYLLNRYLLHTLEGKGILFDFANYHIKHHQFPSQPQYMMIHPVIIFLVSLLISIVLWFVAGLFVLPVITGFLVGYLMFTIIHCLVHYVPIPKGNIFSVFWTNHLLHHSKYYDKAYSVTAPFWDLLFGSAVPKEEFLSIDPNVLNEKVYKLHAIEVNSKESEEAFLAVPSVIYRDNSSWIPPLQTEVEAVFNPSSNTHFEHGTARRWILTDQYGILIGRIAAFVNFQKMYDGTDKIGGIGFFECINNKEAAFYLFDEAVKWLKDFYQIQSVDGPINFGENDKFWGLLVDGFGRPSYGMNYNPPYYKEFFEDYGFQVQYNQLTNHLDLKKPLPDRFINIASRISGNDRYEFKQFDYKHQDSYIKDFVEIYNKAWASFKNFQPLEEKYVRQSLNEIKLVVEESFIWFAYVDGKPAGLLVGMPDFNELLRYVGGKLNFWKKLKFFALKVIKGFSIARVVIMGVVPQYQRIGLESALILNAYNAGRKIPGYKSVQLAWVGDFNYKMVAIHNAMGAVPDKKHATYRKVL